MFYIFSDTNQYFTEWLTHKDKEQIFSQWEYYLFCKFREAYFDEKPNAEEMEAIEYLGILTKAADRAGKYKETESEKLQRLYKCWCKALSGLVCDLKVQTEDYQLNRRARIVLDFLESAFVYDLKHMDKDSDNEKAEECLYRLLGKCFRIREKYGLPDCMRSRRKAARKDPGTVYSDHMKPSEIKAYLDRYIIGQDEAKRVIATAIYAHGIRQEHPEVRFPQNTVLLIGPSGCGKTEILRRIRDLTGWPVVFTDVSSVAPAQWGSKRQIEHVLLMLYEEACGDMERAQQGIVFLDEFDKLLIPQFSDSGKDMSQEIQSQMLTILEGTRAELKRGDQLIVMDTTNILFVLSGAFGGISEFIHMDKLEKSHAGSAAGFGGILARKEWDRITKANINHEVLIKYGMKRELAGRISQVAILESLSAEALFRILTEAEDSVLARYQNETELISGIRVEIEEELIRQIAKETEKGDTGARGLYSRLREVLRDMLYELPEQNGEKQITIDAKAIWVIGGTTE